MPLSRLFDFVAGTIIQSGQVDSELNQLVNYLKGGGGQLAHNVSSVGNVGAGEDDLHSHTIPANTLTNNGDSLQLRFSGRFANNANTKTVIAYFGGMAFFTSGGTAFQNGGWSLIIDVVRIDSDSVTVAFTWGFNAASGNGGFSGSVQIDGLSFAGSLIAKITGTATSDNDITCHSSVIRKFTV